MFWSDVTTDTIHVANLDGSEEEILVDTCISNVGMPLQIMSSLYRILRFVICYIFR